MYMKKIEAQTLEYRKVEQYANKAFQGSARRETDGTCEACKQ